MHSAVRPRVGLFLVVFGAVLLTVGCSANVAGNCFGTVGTNAAPTVCGTTSCASHTYCANPSGGVCSDGCTKNSDCETNETCDLSNAQTDLGGNEVGSCKLKTLSEQQSSTCGDAGTSDGGDAGTKGAPEDAGHD